MWLKDREEEIQPQRAPENLWGKIQDAVVSGFRMVSDKRVEKPFFREGETVEESKERLRRK